MPRSFNASRAAAALVEAALKPDAEVAAAYGVGVRTIESWRARLKTDPAFYAEFQRMSQTKLIRWQTKIPDCLDRAIDFIMQAAERGDPTNPEMVRAISSAIVQLNEVMIIGEALESRKRQAALN